MSAFAAFLLLAASRPSFAADEKVRVMFVGDVMLAHRMKTLLEEKGYDYPFEKVRWVLERGDFVFGNLESPISERGDSFPDKEFHFAMAPPTAAALKRAGFRALGLANNHVFDYGAEALDDTLKNLAAQDILFCGAGPTLADARRPAIVTANGRRVAFLAYSRTFPVAFSASTGPGTAFAEEAFVREDVARAKKSADWVVVSFHWGEEYSATPAPGQKKLARAAIDAGADFVVGHHPHVPQGFELYKGKVIAYSLGNFVFGTRNPRAVNAMVLRLTLSEKTRVEVVPILVNNKQVDFQPRPLAPSEIPAFYRRLARMCRPLGVRPRLRKNRIFIP